MSPHLQDDALKEELFQGLVAQNLKKYVAMEVAPEVVGGVVPEDKALRRALDQSIASADTLTNAVSAVVLTLGLGGAVAALIFASMPLALLGWFTALAFVVTMLPFANKRDTKVIGVDLQLKASTSVKVTTSAAAAYRDVVATARVLEERAGEAPSQGADGANPEAIASSRLMAEGARDLMIELAQEIEVDGLDSPAVERYSLELFRLASELTAYAELPNALAAAKRKVALEGPRAEDGPLLTQSLSLSSVAKA